MREYEKKRRANMEDWHRELQEFADKCTFWIFSVQYPWNHKTNHFIPKSLGDTMTLMGDGFPMIRFRVIEGGKRYKLLQYRFTRSSNGDKMVSDAGLLLRAFQKYVWEQEWNEDISEAQLREYMHWLGLISYGKCKKAVSYIEKGKPIPIDLVNRLSLQSAISSSLPLAGENWGIKS